jgi:hypothetical protein
MSEFKVGDKVVLKSSSQNKVMTIQESYKEFIRAYWDKEHYSFAHKVNFRFAEDEEIAAGHRIDKPSNPRELEVLDRIETTSAHCVNQRMFEMDKPQSFEEVFKDAYDFWIDDADIHRYEGAKGLADQVWQHQQAKVEGLQKQVTDLDNRATQYALDEMATAKLNGELQKRVESLRRKQEAAEKLIWKWAESTEHAHFALQCASELKEALEVRGAPVLEAEGRFYVLGMEGWIAGVYASRKAAELAYETKDNSEFLEKLAYEINQKQGRDITLGDLEQALKGEG